MIPKCVQNKKMSNKVQQSVLPMFSPHFGFFCALLLTTPRATWNLSVKYNREEKNCQGNVIFVSVLH